MAGSQADTERTRAPVTDGKKTYRDVSRLHVPETDGADEETDVIRVSD